MSYRRSTALSRPWGNRPGELFLLSSPHGPLCRPIRLLVKWNSRPCTPVTAQDLASQTTDDACIRAAFSSQWVTLIRRSLQSFKFHQEVERAAMIWRDNKRGLRSLIFLVSSGLYDLLSSG